MTLKEWERERERMREREEKQIYCRLIPTKGKKEIQATKIGAKKMREGKHRFPRHDYGWNMCFANETEKSKGCRDMYNTNTLVWNEKDRKKNLGQSSGESVARRLSERSNRGLLRLLLNVVVVMIIDAQTGRQLLTAKITIGHNGDERCAFATSVIRQCQFELDEDEEEEENGDHRVRSRWSNYFNVFVHHRLHAFLHVAFESGMIAIQRSVDADSTSRFVHPIDNHRQS